MAKKVTTSKKKKLGSDHHRWKDHKTQTLHGGQKVKLGRDGTIDGTSALKIRDVKKDPELGPEPKDAASKHKYPPPRKNPLFRAKWMRYIDTIIDRTGFIPAQLDALEILCNLMVDEDELGSFLRRHGHTYKSISRFGETWKMYPEAAHLAKVRMQVNKYMSNLGLYPKKTGNDLKKPDGPQEGDDW